MQRRQLFLSIFKTFAASMIAGRFAAAQEDLDPVHLMPDSHKVILENIFVRIVEGRVPAGGFEPKHRHPHNVLVFLADFDAEIRVLPDGKWLPTHRTAGTAVWNEAGMHEVKIVGNAPSHTIRIELKS